MEKKYSLSKQESDKLNNLLSVAKIQEEMLNAINQTYKSFIEKDIFGRLGIDVKLFPYTQINLGTGEVIINEPKKEAPPVPVPTSATPKK